MSHIDVVEGVCVDYCVPDPNVNIISDVPGVIVDCSRASPSASVFDKTRSDRQSSFGSSVASANLCDASRDAVDKLRPGGTPTPRSLGGSDDEAADANRCGQERPRAKARHLAHRTDEDDALWRAAIRTRSCVLNSHGDWGTSQPAWPPKTSPGIAKGLRTGRRVGTATVATTSRWDHFREAKRRAEVEARGRADVADLYE